MEDYHAQSASERDVDIVDKHESEAFDKDSLTDRAVKHGKGMSRKTPQKMHFRDIDSENRNESESSDDDSLTCHAVKHLEMMSRKTPQKMHFRDIDSEDRNVSESSDEDSLTCHAVKYGEGMSRKTPLKRPISDINSEDKDKSEAIHSDSMRGPLTMKEIQFEFDQNETGYKSKVVERSADSHFDLNAKNKMGTTAMMVAALNNHCELVNILIKAGCNIHCKDEDGNEAIHLASINGSVEIVKLLLESHVDPNVRNNRQRTPVIFAALNNHCETVRILIEAGCDIHSKDVFGDQAIHWASRRGHVLMLKYLLQSGADANAMGKGEMTPLITTAFHNQRAAAEVLIEAACDIHNKDEHGNEAIHWAVLKGHVEIVKLLLEFNADKNARGEEKRTPLIMAAYNNHDILVKILIEAGCDINSRDAQGKQAYEYAFDQGSKDSVDILRKLRSINEMLHSDQSNEVLSDTWHFQIPNEEIYLTNANMSSMMELYVPQGALPSGSSSLVKATIYLHCKENQEGQFGPTISLLPHGIKLARPILALIRLPYDDLLNAEEFEFIVLHSDTDDDAPKEWVDITEFKEGETSGVVVPEHNVSMVVLFHFSFLTWFRRRRTKILQVLVFTSFDGEILTVTCRFCPADDEHDKGVYANCKYTDICRPQLVISSENSPIDVNITDTGKAWKILSPQDQNVNHDLEWRTNSFPELKFVFEMGDHPSRFVCNIVAQQKKGQSTCTVTLPKDLLGNRPEKASEASNSSLGPKMVAGSESKTKLSLPREFEPNYTVEENSIIRAQLNRLIPEGILKKVNENRVDLAKGIIMSTELLNHLKSKEVFTTEQLENIKMKDGLTLEQASMVIDMLPRLSYYRYLMFRDCLTATNQEHFCVYLPSSDSTVSA